MASLEVKVEAEVFYKGPDKNMKSVLIGEDGNLYNYNGLPQIVRPFSEPCRRMYDGERAVEIQNLIDLHSVTEYADGRKEAIGDYRRHL